MIIYNITLNIEESAQQEWLKWMSETHIKEVLNTGTFTSAKMSKVLVEEQMGGITYSIQYTCESQEKLDVYNKDFAPALQAEHNNKFQGKFVAFRTLMEVISEF